MANPESIFIDKTYDYSVANSGLEIVDQRAINLGAYSGYDDDAGTAWPYIHIQTVNFEPPDPVSGGGVKYRNRFFGGGTIFRGGLFTVNSYMSDYPDWAIGQNNFYRGVTDLIYTFDSHWDGQAVFCVEALNENIMAAGFEHGISVLNIQNLDSIYEVAYYMDLDSTMDITHLAMKESRIYAMGHPRDGYVRLYMFDVGDSVVSGIGETMPAKPSAIEISAYPNPFNSAVTIAVDCRGLINQTPTVEIFDLNGRKIDVIARRAEPNEAISPNNRSSVPLDTRRDAVSINNCEFVWQPDESLPSGVYLVRARGDSRSLSGAEATIATKRIVYLK